MTIHNRVIQAAFALILISPALAIEPCRIEVVEKGTNWPVPLVQLTTTSEVTFVTDNAGVVAFDLPECMNKETWLTIKADGYEVHKDGFGSQGVRFTPTPGGTKRIEVERTEVAKLLGRLTGSGIFGESQKLGQMQDWVESGVVGQDTVEIATYHQKLYWAWGDTGVFNYPLGFFNTSSATSSLQPLTSFQPPIGIVYDYCRDKNGTPHGVVDMPQRPIWVGAYTTLQDGAGKEHLVCTYTAIANHLEPVEVGLAEWDDATSMIKPVRTIWKKGDADASPKSFLPGGHPAFWTDGAGKKWAYFGEGFPSLRCPATYEAWKDPSTWEKVQRPESLVSAKDGSKVDVATGSIAWSAYRKRWVAILCQKFGKPSFLGELWYSEADSPTGPWGPAVKVVTHQNYSFYNPLIHMELAPQDASFLLFEGTYTAEFADHPAKTPRYNYNQILYRLDYDDPALKRAEETPVSPAVSQ